MIYIPIIIIITILLLDFYLTYDIRFKGASTETESFSQSDEVVRFKDPNPWNKVIYQDKGNKYYLKIKNINKYINKIMLWKQLPTVDSEMIDIDIEKNYLIIKAKEDAEALVNTNLLLSYINDEIDPDNVLGKKFIPSSIRKAKKYKLVATKITELIKESVKNLNKSKVKVEETNEENQDDNQDNNNQNNNQHDNQNDNYNPPGIVNNAVIVSPTSISTEPPNIKNIVNNVEPIVKQDLPLEMFTPAPRIMPYEGTEYASVSFMNY
jgi:hypothetical protein